MAGRYTEKDILMVDALINKEYATKTAYTVATLAGSKFTSSLIKKRAHALGFSSYKNEVQWTRFDIEFVQNNYPTKKSMRQLANYFDVNIYRVSDMLKKIGLLDSGQGKSPLRKSMAACADDYDSILGSLWGAYYF